MRFLSILLLLFLFMPATADAYTLFSQNDPQWANYRLGYSNTTIGEYGCFLTSLAMVTSDYTDSYINPLDLHNLLLDLPDVFVYGNGEFATPVISKLFPDIRVADALTTQKDMSAFDFTYVSDRVLRETIRTHLAHGEYVLAHVDSTPEDGYDHAYDQHWVVLVATVENDYIALDPFDGKQMLVSHRYWQVTHNGTRAPSVLSAVFITQNSYKTTHLKRSVARLIQ